MVMKFLTYCSLTLTNGSQQHSLARKVPCDLYKALLCFICFIMSARRDCGPEHQWLSLHAYACTCSKASILQCNAQFRESISQCRRRKKRVVKWQEASHGWARLTSQSSMYVFSLKASILNTGKRLNECKPGHEN